MPGVVQQDQVCDVLKLVVLLHSKVLQVGRKTQDCVYCRVAWLVPCSNPPSMFLRCCSCDLSQGERRDVHTNKGAVHKPGCDMYVSLTVLTPLPKYKHTPAGL